MDSSGSERSRSGHTALSVIYYRSLNWAMRRHWPEIESIEWFYLDQFDQEGALLKNAALKIKPPGLYSQEAHPLSEGTKIVCPNLPEREQLTQSNPLWKRASRQFIP